MSYDKARDHLQSKSAYRLELRRARAVAIRLAAKLMQDAVEGKTKRIVTLEDGKTKEEDYVPREAVQAMAEVLKEARETFAEDGKKAKRNKPGSPTDVEAALRELES